MQFSFNTDQSGANQKSPSFSTNHTSVIRFIPALKGRVKDNEENGHFIFEENFDI